MEPIVFVDEQGRPTGETGPKLASHTADTQLHLAFSCYIFNNDGQLLVTRRALTKKVWAGVWTNSVCGHPLPGERLTNAIHRRAQCELGMAVTNITPILPKYRYKTPPFNGIIENEFCPVFAARAASDPRPNPEEVAEYTWLSWQTYSRRLRGESYSYWAKDQYAGLVGSPELLVFLNPGNGL
ncbi:MAG TPA: isopentenyl-diphosphate Delta-isomerase [Candidatus Saccharimonadales bacterium]|nr:isopentenyl-diphosphate Delta-isomerase [Candidatus Saccharimonadales bacterium]